MNLCEFKASLVYRGSARTDSKAIQRNPVPPPPPPPKKKKKKKELRLYCPFLKTKEEWIWKERGEMESKDWKKRREGKLLRK